MRVEPEPQEVRRLVVRMLSGLGVAQADLFDLEETVLVDEGRYTARSYRVAGFMAMWLVEVGILQFYDAEGSMLATVNLLQEAKPMKTAA